MSAATNQPFVVVGVSARSHSPTALRWAADAAARRDARLVAVRALRPGTVGGAPSAASGPPGAPGQRSAASPSAATGPGTRGGSAGEPGEDSMARSRLEADVAGVLGPDHGAEVRIVQGGKRHALLNAAEGADLLVIDAPRSLDVSAGPGFLQRLLHGLDCPLVVVPRAVSGAPLSRAARAAGRAIAESAGRTPRPGYGHPQPTDR